MWTAATLTWSGSAAGTYGSFTVNADGTWSFLANTSSPAVQALAHGRVVTETFKATVSDGRDGVETVNVMVAITGANDAPVIGGVVSGTVVESGDIASSAGPACHRRLRANRGAERGDRR